MSYWLARIQFWWDKSGSVNVVQWNLYKADTIGAWALYGDVRFIEIPYKNKYLAKINQEWVFEVNWFHRVKKGHVEWSEKCFYFKNNKRFLTLPKCTIKCTVIGKRVNHGAGYGLEIHVNFKFLGSAKAIQWAEKAVKKVIQNIVGHEKNVRLTTARFTIVRFRFFHKSLTVNPSVPR